MGKNLKKQKQFRFSDSELELLERVKGASTYTETIIRGLRALEAQHDNQPSNAELLAMLRERLRE